jgi:hypothetical protein
MYSYDNSEAVRGYVVVMPREYRSQTMRSLLSYGMMLTILLSVSRYARSQDTPMITGGVGFFSSTNKGPTSFDPTFMPLVAVPVTQNFLLEGRGYALESVTPRRNGESDQTKLFYGLSYLQLDYLATRHLTLVAGKFLTPFATYNERLTPIWIGNFQASPLIFSIGTLNGAGTGGEARGSLFSNAKVSVDYAAYMSANVAAKEFKSSRATGGRVNAYFPSHRIEVGTSYGRMFEGAHEDASGAHFWWQPWSIPLSIRSEYGHGTHAQGYWMEAGYRLSQFKGPDSVIGRFEPVFRMQQVFRNSPDPTDGLPGTDTQRADFGFDYFLPHEVRIITSYSRQFSSTGNGNIWQTGLVYRFLTPAWPGKQ